MDLNEWNIVLTVVVLVDLFSKIYNPMSKSTKENTKAMTELTVTMKMLSEKVLQHESDMDSYAIKNHDSHKRIWDKNEEQDVRLENHETRLKIIEEKEK